MMVQEKLRYIVAVSSLGKVFIVVSSQGVRAILIDQAYDADMQYDNSLEELASKIVEHINNPKLKLEIKIDMQGNDFQRKVWNALRDIPVGSTVTYRELAKNIGVPGAARAVGKACAANSIAVVIPCHRVVRSDGGISGYRWGVENKKRLLEREGINLTSFSS